VFCVVFHTTAMAMTMGVRRADTARAHARWWQIVASHEVTNTLHQTMCLALYLPGGMVVAIAIESITSYIIE
jgi:hypothetical protein